RYTDEHVAAIVEKLRARGLWDRALFILTADHGESLGEHAYYFQHGWFLYDDCLRVPLLVHAPGIAPARRRARSSIGLLDGAPTILEAVDVPAPAAMEGQSLLPLLRADGADRPAFAQTYYGDGLVGMRLGRMKYVFKPKQADVAERPRGNSEPPGSSA